MTGPSSDARVLEAASYTLTVSGDPRLLATVRALSARTAETAGVAPRDAARLADAVWAVMEAVGQAGTQPGTTPRLLTVRFDIGQEALHVAIMCEPPDEAPAGWTLERELVAYGRLDDLRAAAPDAEIGAAIDAESGAGRVHHYCRLTCALSRRS